MPGLVNTTLMVVVNLANHNETLRRGNSNLWDMSVLDDAVAFPPFVEVAYLPAEGFSGCFTGRVEDDNVGRCVVCNFLEDTKSLVLMKRFWTLPWLEPPFHLDFHFSQ